MRDLGLIFGGINIMGTIYFATRGDWLWFAVGCVGVAGLICLWMRKP